jgi:hypothetical protein
VAVRAVGSGLGPGDAPDLGGGHFVLLETPRVAMLARDPFGPSSVGEVWHLLDHEMGLRLGMLDAAQLGGADLRRYNVLIIPDGGGAGWTDRLGDLKAWVESGGTLIAIGSSAGRVCAEKDGIGSTRVLADVLTKRDEARAAIVRDWLGKTASADAAAAWSHTAPASLEYPWRLGERESVDEDEAKRRDAWRELFMPQGAILAGRVDDRHWLTAGCGEVLPVLVGSGPVLIPKWGGHAPVLLGAIVPAEARADAPSPAQAHAPAPDRPAYTESPSARPGSSAKAEAPAGAKPEELKKEEPKKEEKPAPGWLVAPPGHELRLRMSGLLWPEAADRLAHSAYVTRERVGLGQLILFNESPVFRAATRGSARLLMNAVVCGPGMGASAPIQP